MSAATRYYASVQKMDCAYCHAPGPSDPHHYGPREGYKASDFSVVPLCRRCHRGFHATRKIGLMDVAQTREWLLLQIIALLIAHAEERDA